MVKLQEAENQIVTAYEVYGRRPRDCDLLIGAIETRRARLARTPPPAASRWCGGAGLGFCLPPWDA
jgi:hypothetical protein